MKIFIEAEELNSSTHMRDFIRLDITNKENENYLQDLIALLNPNKKYKIQVHKCRKDEGRRCTYKELKNQILPLK